MRWTPQSGAHLGHGSSPLSSRRPATVAPTAPGRSASGGPGRDRVSRRAVVATPSGAGKGVPSPNPSASKPRPMTTTTKNTTIPPIRRGSAGQDERPPPVGVVVVRFVLNLPCRLDGREKRPSEHDGDPERELDSELAGGARLVVSLNRGVGADHRDEHAERDERAKREAALDPRHTRDIRPSAGISFRRAAWRPKRALLWRAWETG
jgi:hypothetical protein